MPLIDCTLIKGYSAETRKLLLERLTDAASSVIGAHPDFVIGTVHEVAPENYMRGRVSKTPASAPRQPGEIVKAYLNAMEARDLEAAQRYLGKDFEMVFPGGVTFQTVEQLVGWGKTRYQSVGKKLETVDESFHGLDAVVNIAGTLHGIWLDGSAFEGIRFVDRFTLTGGVITRQEVWNDMGEVMVASGLLQKV